MKFLIPIMFLLVFITSCDKDQDHNPTTPKPTTVLEDLTIADVYDLLPAEQYKSHKYVVFVDSTGTEKWLRIVIEEGYKNMTVNKKPYRAQFWELSLVDSLDVSYSIGSKLRTSYTASSLTPSPHCFSALFTGYNNGYMPTITVIKNGEISIGLPIESIVIANKTFTNVITQLSTSDYNSYAKIYFVPGMGVIGFQGENSVMWAFDRFK